MEDLGGLLGKQLEELQEKANEMAGNLKKDISSDANPHILG